MFDWTNVLSTFGTTILGAYLGVKLNAYYSKKKNVKIKNNLCVAFGNKLITLHTHLCLAINSIPKYQKGTFDILFLPEYQEKFIPYLDADVTLEIQELYNRLQLLKDIDLINHADTINELIDLTEKLYNDIKINGMPVIEKSHVQKLKDMMKYDYY